VSGVHQTVSGAPGSQANEHATLGNSLDALRYNSPNCLVCTGLSGVARQRSTAQMNSDEKCRAEVRGHRTVRCNKKTKGSNGQQLQTPTNGMTWRTPDIEQ
jgi:hypothetical protein